ncbi:hypothetical protein [uncultured Methanobrevibacter sp.]|uniref:hypothetical protein n=1 Tax=uncultured Methanobrevibacter sp. TaxID=253161 RepID=UPI0025DB0DBF|nr:hypothetical protein [uncultured Methanobrevibacter sp.]
MFIELQKEFEERRNYREILKRIRETNLIADSDYSSTENLYYLFINKINALIMPKKLSEMHNNKLRRKNELQEKRKKSSKNILLELKTVISVQMVVS